jgi:hypothetical protein
MPLKLRAFLSWFTPRLKARLAPFADQAMTASVLQRLDE